MKVRLRVIKLGGSLLDWPPLVPRFQAWLARQSPATNLLIAGGGRLADAIREADRIHTLPTDAAHWLAIRAMTLQARLLASLLPEAIWLERVSRLNEAVADGALILLDPYKAIRAVEESCLHRPLPRSWDVTSDSLSAWLAHVCQAEEMVLLKSTSLPTGADVAQAAASGYVDRYFPQLVSPKLTIRWVNLRDETGGVMPGSGDVQPP